MSEKEKKIAKALAEAAKALPDEKKEYLLGYAEGVAAMAWHYADAKYCGGCGEKLKEAPAKSSL